MNSHQNCRRWFSLPNAPLALTLLLAGIAVLPRLKAEEPKQAVESLPATHAGGLRLDAHCIDGSLIKVNLLDEKIPIKTDYGRIEILSADIERIDFADRLPADLEQRIKEAVLNLGDAEYNTREAANAELLELGAIAYPAILEAAESQDPEVMQRSEKILEHLRSATTEDELQVRDFDTISTAKSQIGGTIDLESLKVQTKPFGQQQLKLNMLRRIGGGEDADPKMANALSDPGSLMSYGGQAGKTVYFKISATPDGARRSGYVWGTDVYTLDSTLALAALHAGAIKSGQSKVVGVTFVENVNAFTGSTRNGITSGSWSSYPGGFKFKATKSGPASRAAKR